MSPQAVVTIRLEDILLADVGLSVDKLKSKTVRGDFGVIFGDSVAPLTWPDYVGPQGNRPRE